MTDPVHRFTLDLRACTPEFAARVGGKARGLHFLIEQGLPVPEGFVVLTDAYRECIAAAGIEQKIAELAARPSTPGECEAASQTIRALFNDQVMVTAVWDHIASAYHALDARKCAVAVRSSATAEDLADASFAGQQDTYLHIRGAAEVCRHVLRCWASLYTAQAIGYRARLKVPQLGLAMAVVVQRMVAAEAAGVMMTLDPTNGDAATIYLESALGLGEGVVRGDVECDRFWVDKPSGAISRREVSRKLRMHRFDSARNRVGLMDVAAANQDSASLVDAEVLALARFARQAEQAFGAAVDMEWAVGPGKTGSRDIFLLQSRPETVWAGATGGRRPSATVAALAGGRPDAWDTLHGSSDPHEHWSTSNFGEAIPGVSTPLSWSIWGPALESAMRGSVYAIGGFNGMERELPKSRDAWFARSFFGRPALNVQYLATVGDRMPGTTGQAVVRDLLGRVPSGMSFTHTMRRYPIIAWRLPYTFFTVPGRVWRAAADTTRFWQTTVDTVPSMEHAAVVALLNATVRRFRAAVTLQATLLLGSISPLYDAIAGLVKRTGVGDTGSLSGFGGAEIDVVSDLFRAAHGRCSIDEVVRRHGFHGPLEGELSSTVWREDPAPLMKLLHDYAARDAADDPRLHSERRRTQAQAVQHQMLAALPLPLRPLARLLLKLAAERIPMRGIPKRSFLQLFDVLRVCARRLGVLLVSQGKLAQPDDVFYLTVEELCGDLPDNVPELIALRRTRRAAYQRMSIPADWQGVPPALPAQSAQAFGNSEVRGIGVSPGVIEGRARVLLEPDFSQVQSGEILVTPTTDPSWSSVMFISIGLVVDIGGALSHAAIVARELGIPCVVNTKTGSQVLCTGDLIRVDGSAGSIDIIERAAPIAASRQIRTG